MGEGLMLPSARPSSRGPRICCSRPEAHPQTSSRASAPCSHALSRGGQAREGGEAECSRLVEGRKCRHYPAPHHPMPLPPPCHPHHTD